MGKNAVKDQQTESAISFRFRELSKLQALTLRQEIITSTYDTQVENQTYMGSVPLTTDDFEDIINFYIRQKISLVNCDIVISVAASGRAGTVKVPAIVNQMLKHIDCQLAFNCS